MIQEIYIKSPNEPGFISDILDFDNVKEAVIQKVKMILGTIPGQVLGDPNFGVALEDYVFKTKVSQMELQNIINDQLTSYIGVVGGYTVSSNVSFGKSDNGFDYAIIDININEEKIIGFLVD